MVLEYSIRGISLRLSLNAKREYRYFKLCVCMFKNTMLYKKKQQLKNPVRLLLFLTWFSRDELNINCLNCVHNCDDHSWLDFKSAVQYCSNDHSSVV